MISPLPLIIEELINKNDLQESYFAGSPLVAYSQTVSLREWLTPSSSRKPKVQANPAWIKEEPLSIFSGFLLFLRGFINYAKVRKMPETFSNLPRTRVLFIY